MLSHWKTFHEVVSYQFYTFHSHFEAYQFLQSTCRQTLFNKNSDFIFDGWVSDGLTVDFSSPFEENIDFFKAKKNPERVMTFTSQLFESVHHFCSELPPLATVHYRYFARFST